MTEGGDQGRFWPLVDTLARHFGRNYSRAAVERGLPDDVTRDEAIALPRALSAVGLRSDWVQRDLREIDPIVLPCVLFGKAKSPFGVGPVLLMGLKDGLATLVDPREPDTSTEVPVRKLRRQVDKRVLYVTASEDRTAERLAPESRVEAKGHWLWGAVRGNAGAWAQIIVAAFAINILALAVPIFVMNVYDRVIPNLAFVTLWTLAGGVAIALGLDLVLKLIRTAVLEGTSRRIDVQVASRLFGHAMDLKLTQRPGGAAGIASQIRDFDAVRDFFTSSSFIALIDLLFIGVFVFVLWTIVGPIAVVPLAAVPVVILLGLIAQVPIARAVDKAQALSAKRHTVLVEALSGIETVKAVVAEPVMQREWENAVAATARINGRTRFWGGFAASGTMLVQQAVSILIILWGVYLVSDGQITVGGLIAANILAGRVLAPLGSITQTLVRASTAVKSYSAINALAKLPVEGAGEARSALPVRKGALSFRKVSVSYPGAPVPALNDIDLDIAAGETVALLGRVGSGKSTFGRLACGMLEADQGIILVDGQEIGQYERADLRDGIGYLPQDPDLFTGSIRENLLLGRTRASDEALNRALYFAGMDHFISENPEGLDQFVGERGNRLSGGQRQAIGLARLLLREPKMLFLDEPTNAMDSVTEAIVT
ncbi:MAG: ATP-binding cassette domain-containing protein, partial [Pseudomonadota bacterium]